MSRPNPIVLLLVVLGVAGAMGAAAVLKGGFYVAKHEGDTLHLLQIVLRMADGEWPHLDFMTPLGALAFWPIVAFVQAGFGVGSAILWSQGAVAAVLALPTLWAAFTRLNGWLAYGFGGLIMVLCLALVHGEADQLVSISMHYNRWAWAISYVVILLAVLPPLRLRAPWLDGALIGLGTAALLLIKVTYVISFAPVLLIALIVRRDWAALIAAFVAGVAVLVVVTVVAGPAFWGAYIGDLLAVAGSEVRPQPGAPLGSIIGAPAYLGGSLALLAGVIFLRQAGEEQLGLCLFLLVPGFFYVTFQNFGNDPQWLMLLAILLLVPQVAPEAVSGLGLPLKRALSVTAVAAMAFAAPSVINLTYSPFRHLSIDAENYTQLLPGQADLFGRLVRSNRVDGTVGLDGPGSGLEDRRELAEREDLEVSLNGEVLPDCELGLGLIAWFEVIVADLEANGYGSAKIFAADIFTSHWLFGDVARLPEGSPWYYGGLPGFAGADYVLVPLCPASQPVRKQILETLEERGVALTEVHRAPHYILAQAEG